MSGLLSFLARVDAQRGNFEIAPAHALDGLADLDKETRDLYLGGNAHRVLGL
jgi:hypothetical protein